MEIYKITNEDQLTNDLICSLIERYKQKEVPRLQRLHNYYVGSPDIKKRAMSDTSKPNNKIANPYASYIVDTIQGYFLGQPIAYQCEDEDMMVRIQSIFDKNHEQAHNSKMGKRLSITSVAYELTYINEDIQVSLALLNPEEVFMVYDNSITQEPIGAVRFYEVEDYTADKSVTQLEMRKEVPLPRATLNEKNWLSQKRNHTNFNTVRVVCSSYAEGSHTYGHHTPVKDTIQT